MRGRVDVKHRAVLICMIDTFRVIFRRQRQAQETRLKIITVIIILWSTKWAKLMKAISLNSEL